MKASFIIFNIFVNYLLLKHILIVENDASFRKSFRLLAGADSPRNFI